MKKLLLLFMASACLVVYAINIKAQITVDSTDYATIGDTVVIANDTVPPVGISVGGTGAQTWDFTALQVDYLDTLTFRDIDNGTDDSLYPGSNLVMETPYQDIYLDFNASWLNVLGFLGDPFDVGINFPLNFNPPQKRIEFPSSLGSSFLDTSKSVLVIDAALLGLPVPNLDSIRINHYGYANSIIDAYGTVDIPSGTYNTIRQFYTENTIDSIWGYCSDPAGCFSGPFGWSLAPVVPGLTPYDANPIVDTTYTYRWLANNQDFPVVELETDTAGGNVTVARFKIDTAVVAQITSVTGALCKDSCNGSAVATGISGVKPYSYLWNDPNSQTTATATGLCDGNYSAWVIDAIGDTSTAAIAIVSEPLTALSGGTITTTADTNGTADGTATVAGVTGGTGVYTYSWSTTPPQTSTTATGLTAGPYTVTVTDANGCTYAISDTVDAFSGINEKIDAKNDIRIYPNPAVNELNVVAPSLNIGVVRIYNILGKQMMSVALESTITKVNTSELARGLYIYKVSDVDGAVLKNGKFSVIK